MLQPVRWVLWLLARLILPLRYRITVRGSEQLRGVAGPTLILPSHPAFVDPLLVLLVFWPRLRPRPMLYEVIFRNPLLYPLMKLINAVQIPDLEQTSLQARAQAERAVAEVVAGLKAGNSHVLWPAGRLRRSAGERLGAGRAVADILQAAPEANVLLVRTCGLWGSRFSYAFTGQRPSLLGGLFRGAALLLGNLLFFMPRRHVTMTVERFDRRQLPDLRRETVNPWLERWYNAGGPEAPSFVPYHFLFGPRSHEFPQGPTLAEADLGQVKSTTKAGVAQILAERLGRPLSEAEQHPETTLDALGLDSLDRMELTLRVEQQFGFSGEQTPATVGQLWALAEGLVEKGPPKSPPPAWFVSPSDKLAPQVHGTTLAEAFVTRALMNPRDVAAADDLAGVVTYERMLVGALTLARRFANLPADHIGLMLPASVACDVAFLALQLAGKVPVMLNWTTGPAHLAHAVASMRLAQVVTSRRFLDRSGVSIERVEYLFVEDLRQSVGRWELLRTLLQVRLFPGRVRSWIPRPGSAPTPESHAVILFTSGSEKAPKTVPLTHTNILSDQRSGLAVMNLTRRDSLLSCLPMFHSFGITVTALVPLLSGVRVVHHPDPTDAAGLARKIAAYRVTIAVATPTVVGYMLDRARPGELDSLRLIIVGAEKCPPSVFERCARVAPAAAVLEGYGVTECSPAISFNPPAAIRPGTIGKAIPGIAVAVVDLETNEELPANRRGMLLVSGPIVFPGYLGHEGPPPFVERDGKRWYVTGDLAEIDADGYLIFHGRLKRFLKAGGEMISLPALEEPFERQFPPTPEGPRVAVEGIEREGGRRIVLFTTEPIGLAEANARLHGEGFRGVMRLDEVRRLSAIPVLGTGKTDYKVLRARLAEEARGANGPSALG
jgi:long-chain-fatty-acid--[acyl-carrier-protein] ligase